MYHKLDECPSCKHTAFDNHLICEDHAHTHESFALVKCRKCQLVFTNPRPDQDVIGRYYEHANYISHTNKANNFTNLAYKAVRYITLRQKNKLISNHHPTGKILDYGAGTGIFSSYMQSKGYEVHALEPNTDARSQIINVSEVFETLTDIPKNQKYQAITAWHVLEHVHDLKETLLTLRKALVASGTLFIALPNMASYDAAHYHTHWAAYDVPRHLYHFTPSSFRYLAHKLKMEVIQQLPMPFDAYYVSILSQKYLGHPNITSALKAAYLSNQKAKHTGNYSSLIYICKVK